MSKKLTIFITGCLLFAGCAHESRPRVDSEAGEQAEAAVEANAALLSAEDDLLFLLLAAELAGQRGQYEVALEGYLAAAEKSDDPRVAERAMQIALYLKDDEKLQQAVTIWSGRDSQNLTARKMAAVVALKRGDLDSAKSHLDFLLASDSAEFESALFETMKLFGADTRKQEVYDLFDRLADIYPLQPEVPYAYALLAIQQNDFDLALTQVAKALVLAPDMSDAVGLQAQIVSQTGDPEEAKQILRKAVQNNPGSMQFRMMYAQALIKLGEYDAAMAELKRILEKDADYDDARFALALVELQVDREDAAYRNLQRLSRSLRWSSPAALYLGRIEARRGHLQKALSWFDQVTSGPAVMEAQVTAISLLISHRRYDEAESRLEELYEQFPDQGLRLSLVEAELLSAQRRYDEAYELLTAALADMPEQPELLYARALVAERLGRIDVLERDLKAILEKRPDDVNALNALGYTLVDRTDRYEEAKGYLERAIAMRPEDPAIMDSYGWLQYRLGNYELALKYLRSAYERAPEAEIAAHLGEVLWVTGRRSEARKVWRKALRLSPDDEHLEDVRRRFKEAFAE